MSADPHMAPPAAEQIDRWSEFANIGAGHAAGALGSMVGQAIRMRVPQVVHRGGREAPLPFDPSVAVFFGVQGSLGGHFTVLLSKPATGPFLEALLGAPVSLREESAQSALAEIGNVMASHALSAVADLEDTLVLPTPPDIELESPGPVFARRFGTHTPRIENLLVDDEDAILGALVWVPER